MTKLKAIFNVMTGRPVIANANFSGSVSVVDSPHVVIYGSSFNN